MPNIALIKTVWVFVLICIVLDEKDFGSVELMDGGEETV